MNWERMTKGLAAVCGAVAGLLGEWTLMLTVLAALMGLDYLTGLIVAWRGRSPKTEGGGVSSRVGFDGLIRKAFIMLPLVQRPAAGRASGASDAPGEPAFPGQPEGEDCQYLSEAIVADAAKMPLVIRFVVWYKDENAEDGE